MAGQVAVAQAAPGGPAGGVPAARTAPRPTRIEAVVIVEVVADVDAAIVHVAVRPVGRGVSDAGGVER